MSTFLAGTFTVGTTAVDLHQPPAAVRSAPMDVRSILIYNEDASADLYVGGSAVTANTGAATDGIIVHAGDYHPISAVEGASLGPVYGIVATGSIKVAVEFLGP